MHVFISHVEADREWVMELAKRLRTEGIDVWQDASEVSPGENWLRSAAQALDHADAMILVFSKNTADSPELRKAFEFALSSPRMENRVITVERTVHGRRAAQIPWVLRDLPFVRGATSPRMAARQVLRFLRKAA
jgi:hypothetical protein